MIQVLQDWQQVGEAATYLQRNNLTLHEGPQKNWDHHQIALLFKDLAPNSSDLLDLGCGVGFTLELFASAGFHSILGMDFRISPRAHLRRFDVMWRRRTFSWPYRFAEGDVSITELPGRQFDLITCVSVIEHGVDLVKLFPTVRKLLKPGGRFFLTTDYWADSVFHRAKASWDLPWTIFNRSQISELVETARGAGLLLVGSDEIPNCGERMVVFAGQEYTFISLLFQNPLS